MLSEKSIKALEPIRGYRKECAKMHPYGKRETISGVECILHSPEKKRENMPAVFIMHGGSWIGGDAVLIDSLAKTLSDSASVFAVNVNYTKLDEKPYPNPLDEILSVVSHFQKHHALYGIDPEKCVLMGCSAGAHLAGCASVLAKDRGISIARQILVYPYLDWTGETDTYLQDIGIIDIPFEEIRELYFGNLDLRERIISPISAKDDELIGIAPCDIIACGKDVLRPHAFKYFEKLQKIGHQATIREYENAIHGFLEVNRPDSTIHNEARNDEQAGYTRDLETYLSDILKSM